MDIKLCEADVQDAAAVADIFIQAVRHIDDVLYTEAEKNAWIKGADSMDFWAERIMQTRPVLARCGSQAVGFIEYRPEEAYIDCLYVHPHYQRQGIAAALLAYVQHLAQQQKQAVLHTDASKAALSFFERHGFTVCHTNCIERNNIILVNYRMKRPLWLNQL